MKFKIEPSILSNSLNLIGLVAHPGSPTAEGSSVVLSAKDGKLYQSAISSSVSLRTWVEADIEEEGEAAVDFQMLAADVSSMRSTISAYTTKTTLMLKAGRAERKRRLVSTEGFSGEPDVRGQTLVLEDPSSLIKALEATAFAVIKDGSRPALRCSRIESGLVMGADGLRFSTYNLELPFSASIPPERVPIIKTIVAGRANVKVTVGNWMCIETDLGVLKFALIELPYPSAAIELRKTLLAKTPCVEIEVEKSQTLSILSSLMVYSDRARAYGISHASLDIDSGYPKVIAEIPDIGRFEDELLTKKLSGTMPALLFSPSYLREAISQVTGDTVIIKVLGPKEPILIQDSADQNWLTIQTVLSKTADMPQEAEITQPEKETEEDF